MLRSTSVLLLAAALAACTPPDSTPEQPAGQTQVAEAAANTLTVEERAAGWRLLFDGITTDGWRGFRSDSMPAGWTVDSGALVRSGPGGDIITREEFDDFELSLEWRVQPGGNSGIMYRVTEEASYPFETGPEMQVLDDAGHADGQSRLTAAGSLFGLYAAPEGVVKPAGEWNHARILADGARVEHWLNGQKVVEAELGGDEWNRKIEGTKFAGWEGFGRAEGGHIALQDHGDRVEYRNIKIRELQ